MLKVGQYKVKRNYGILQGFIDVIGFIFFYLLAQITYAFYDSINGDHVLKAIYRDGVPLSAWLPGMIWIVIAVAVVVVSIVLIFKSRKLPKKYNINKENAQKYFDIIATAIGLIRILCFLTIFDMMLIHHSWLLYEKTSIFSLQTILDVIMGFIIIRFSISRIKHITATEEKEKEIIEN